MFKKNFIFLLLTVIIVMVVKGNANAALPLSSYSLKTKTEIDNIVDNAVELAGDNATAQAEAKKHTLAKIKTEQKAIREHIKEMNDERIALDKRKEAGEVLTADSGVYMYDDYQRETYYNLDMSKVISVMRDMGFNEKDFPYWVREDGCKMLGDYIIVAADLSIHPRGTIMETSLGPALVCDTGGFTVYYPYGVDIAVTW